MMKYDPLYAIEWYRVAQAGRLNRFIWYARVPVSGSRYREWVKLVEFET
jgi:hypothetical protein